MIRLRAVLRLSGATLALAGAATACTARPRADARLAVSSDSATRDRALWASDSLRVAALAANDTVTLARIYADEFTMVTSSGELRTKADQLREIGALVVQHPIAAATPGPEAEHVLVRHLYAGATVAMVVSENTAAVVRGADTATARRRYTRVYVWRDGRWQLVSNHISRVSAGVP